MIQNIFIVRDGIALVSQHFGECHSIDHNNHLVTSFISALQSFSLELTGSKINTMIFEDFSFHFYRENNLTFLMVTDIEEDGDEVNFKLKRIAKIFDEKYSEILNNFNGDINQFSSFGNVLLEMKLAQKNCGGHPECLGCPNSDLNSRIIKAFIDSQKT